ncbi:MAG: hypothetical protein RJA98_1081 [Pseudomonadota bacterium]|jgi:cell wall-associated NlpC family hydrolase
MTHEQQRSAVAAEALSWLGTGYHHHGRIKGVGVDCLMLLAEVYERAGVVPHIDPGEYPTDWHLHRSEELYLAGLERHTREVQTPALGDICMFRFGRCYSHGGIVVQAGSDPTVAHAYINRGVILSRLSEDPLNARAMRAFTPWSPAA